MTGHALIEGRNNLDLFRRVAEFNLYLVRYIHSSWLVSNTFAPLFNKLHEGGDADYHLSRYLLQEFRLEDCYDYDFQPLVKRIVLADEKALTRLSLYLGIIVHEESIRNVIMRKERRALEECLGEEAYRFAVKKAQFIGRVADRQGPSLLIDWGHLDRFKAFLEMSGQQIIQMAFAEMSEAFRKRMELKLPAEWQESRDQQEPLSLSSEQCAALVLKAHKEVNREWRHLLS
ncbi:MAG: SctK family type III secretion system sorting platform protein [Endozoicomonas sp.]